MSSQAFIDHLRDEYMQEQDARIVAEDALARVTEQRDALLAERHAVLNDTRSKSRYFACGWIAGLVTATVVASLANLAYTAFFRGTP